MRVFEITVAKNGPLFTIRADSYRISKPLIGGDAVMYFFVDDNCGNWICYFSLDCIYRVEELYDFGYAGSEVIYQKKEVFD